MFERNICTFLLFVVFLTGCSAAKVSRAELEALKAGDVVVFRHDRDGKTWRYAEKITKVDAEKIYYYPSKYESGDGKTYKVATEFDESTERSRTREEYYKFETDQGPERRAIMWIE